MLRGCPCIIQAHTALYVAHVKKYPVVFIVANYTVLTYNSSNDIDLSLLCGY